jgi:hypothetical protein
MPSKTLLVLFMLTTISILNFASSAGALPAPLQVKPGRISTPMQSGVTIGGQAADEFSLLSVKTELLGSGNAERMTLSYGDRFGAPIKSEPGFFQVALDRSAQRIVIDLSQMRKTAVDAAQLARTMMLSKYVVSSDITMDPFDGSTNITLLTKVPVKMSVAALGKVGLEQAKLQIEIQPVGGKP